ncbi:MAG: phage virion morphogenesis protein [Mesorhizobium sp.]|nr:phage virion morphogenesis protein [Mesorhizobium sp.]MBN9243388.1 phage virion morphogenesis protein [Mesorhizobium sp.]
MTGAVLTLDIRNTDDALARLLEAASDLKPALKNIGVELERSTKERIAREESPDGSHFAPLNPLYAKTKKGPGILRGESGDLANIVWQLAGDDTVEVGTNAIYGAIHQFGGVIKARNAAALFFSMGGESFTVDNVTIPARPFLGLSKQDEEEVLAIVADHFQQAAGRALE